MPSKITMAPAVSSQTASRTSLAEMGFSITSNTLAAAHGRQEDHLVAVAHPRLAPHELLIDGDQACLPERAELRELLHQLPSYLCDRGIVRHVELYLVPAQRLPESGIQLHTH